MRQKKVYVCPMFEVLETEVVGSLLADSTGKTTLRKMEIDDTFDNGSSGARETGYDFVFDEE